MTRNSRIFALVIAAFSTSCVYAQPSFTYQGRLKIGNQPASGPHDFVFTLFDAAAGGNVIGGPATFPGVVVTDGLFTVVLNTAGDFGPAAFDGQRRWIEVAVNGTALAPRQEVTAAPYALRAKTVTGPLDLSGDVSFPGAVIRVINVGTGRGVYGSTSTGDFGVVGEGPTGVYGGASGSGGAGVRGVAGDAFGLYGSSLTRAGVRGESNGATGIEGYSGGSFGIFGITDATFDGAAAVRGDYGSAAATKVGYLGSNRAAVWGQASSGLAGRFDGPVFIDGNVGIGTLTPEERLHVSGSLEIDGAGSYARLVLDSTVGGHQYEWYNDFGGLGNGTLALYDRTAGASRITVTPGGNIGIGTLAPDELFHVLGGSVFAEGTTTTPARLIVKSGQPGGHQYEWYPDVAGTGNLGLFDRTAGLARVVVSSTGRVGIGDVEPQATLDVYGDVRWSGTLQGGTIPWARISGFSGDLTPDTIGDDGVISDSEASDTLTINNGLLFAPTTGNVGIGTGNPTRILHVNAGADAPGIGPEIGLGSTGNPMATIGAILRSSNAGDDAGDLVFRTRAETVPPDPRVDPTERMRITANGNVGVGTTTPRATFDVSGTARVSGFQLTTGAQTGYVLKSDSAGNGTWQPAPPQQGIPPGVIVMWSGTLATIPSGWALCNGTGGTPDLRDRFILGTLANENPGATGGSTSHSHTVNAHTHNVIIPSAATSTNGSHDHQFFISPDWNSNNVDDTANYSSQSPVVSSIDDIFGFTGVSGNHSHTVPSQSAITGSTSPPTDVRNHVPPYFKLAFIMKL